MNSIWYNRTFRVASLLAVPALCLTTVSLEARGLGVDVSIGGGGGIDASVSLGGGSGVQADASVGGGSGVQADVNVGGGTGGEVDVSIGGGGTGGGATPGTPTPEVTVSVAPAKTAPQATDVSPLPKIFSDIMGAAVISREGDFVGQVISVVPQGRGARIKVQLGGDFAQQAQVMTLDINRRSVRDGVVRLSTTATKLMTTLASYR